MNLNYYLSRLYVDQQINHQVLLVFKIGCIDEYRHFTAEGQ